MNVTPLRTKDGDHSIQRQVVLPFRKSLTISLQNIRVRFLRSAITTLSLVLAVSFVSFVRVGNDLANGMLSAGDPEIRQALIRAGYDLPDAESRADTSPKQRWIVFLSLLVCVIGIINAQLMAVSERFREIGTMKCLGALDRFILRLFLLEAGIQGGAGAAVGAVVGALAALLNDLVRFGMPTLQHVMAADVLQSILIATLTGCVLSLIGVVYPAFVASRMQPVEAMRVEH